MGAAMFEAAQDDMLRSVRAELVRRLVALGHARGRNAELRAHLVFSEIADWLRTDGHGDVTLSAIGGTLGKNFRTNTVRRAEGNPKT